MNTTQLREQARQARKQAAVLTDDSAADLLAIAASRIESEADAQSLFILAGDLRKHGRERAKAYADLFDTALREQIPLAAWVYMGGELIHG